MGLFHHDSDEAQAHDEVNNAPHVAHLSHELIAAAASWEAAKAYENHQEKPTNHAEIKKILAAASGAFIDHLVETKGLDYISAQRAKKHAEENLSEVSDAQYASRAA